MSEAKAPDVLPANPQDSNKSSKPNCRQCTLRQRVALIFSAIIILSVAGFLSVILLNAFGTTVQRAICKEIAARKKSQVAQGFVSRIPSVQDVVFCNSIRCSFDILECKNVCPFSYELDVDDCPISCKCAAKGIMEGDIQFDETDVPIFLEENGIVNTQSDFTSVAPRFKRPMWRRFRKGEPLTISYYLASDLTSGQVESWKKAIARLQEQTCIRFVIWSNNKDDYLLVKKSERPGCTSYIGRKGGQQNFVLGDCFSPRHVEHMLMHTLGFRHEHTRYDRDAFIEVRPENAKLEHRQKFLKIQREHGRPYRTEFDKKSVTMFNGYAYAIEDGVNPTIVDVITKQPLIVPDRDDFSDSDIIDINHRYCKDWTPETKKQLASRAQGGRNDVKMEEYSWTQWGRWGHCDATCGMALRNRYRSCTTKSGHKLLDKCSGESTMTLPCNVIPCPRMIDLKPRWMPWGAFGACSKSCGTGIRYRSRSCSDGQRNGGACEGSSVDGEECNTAQCSKGQYNRFDPWTEWSACSVVCGTGMMTRYRECKSISRQRARFCGGTVDHRGIEYQTAVCHAGTCAGDATNQDWYANSKKSRMLEEPAWFVRSQSQLPTSICEVGGGSQWLVGDFNGDKKSDVLCRNDDGKVKIVVAGEGDGLEKVSWEGDMDQCMKQKMYSGDFNGDGVSDVLCVAADSFESDLLVFPVRYGKPKDVIIVGDICVGERYSIYVVDANGDGRADILCRDRTRMPNLFPEIHLNVLEL